MLVLGIDAAWTAHHPSGVALLHWRVGQLPALLACARAAEALLEPTGPATWETPVPPARAALDLPPLLAAAARRGQGAVDVLALDLPLAPQPIRGRRRADNLITRRYGGRGAATHSPSAQQPGPLADRLFATLLQHGFTWPAATVPQDRLQTPVFFETYPHAAIIEMLRLPYRLPYKVARRGQYWRTLSVAARWEHLGDALEFLRQALACRITDLSAWIPPMSSLLGKPVWVWKGVEDMLDACVCAWVGCEYLAGRVQAYGDQTGAIWLPRPAAVQR